MDDAMIREVEPEEAEAVLTLRLFVQGVAGGAEDRHYLTRRPPRSVYVVESITTNPDGSVTERGTVTTTEDVIAGHCTFADGVTEDGRGIGCRTSVSVEGRSADEIAVHVSMSWTGRDGIRGERDEALIVPWMGTATRELGGGGWMAAEMTAVANSAEDADTSAPAGS